MKKVYTAIILIVLLCGGVLSANYIFLQRHMNEVLKEIQGMMVLAFGFIISGL